MDNLRKTFSEQLSEIEQAVLKMGEIVEEMLNLAIEALIKKDANLANKVINLDDQVDKYNLEIESQVISLIALQQPMAKDLRFLAGVNRIITDIERMGDYSLDIAKFAKYLSVEKPLELVKELPQMAEVVKRMLKETLSAFALRDLNLIQQMIDDDDKVDNAYRTMYDKIVSEIEKDPSLIRACLQVLMVARYLERIADHITNVGERIYYMETGEMKEIHS